MRIDLATEPDFQLGSMRVSPATREVFSPAGREVLEPRVMMVLVALGQAGGHVVSRDTLTERCWDGLVVGDDAINRVIGRLRKLSVASEAFQIETITKVGYRLQVPDAQSPAQAATPPAADPGARAPTLRRPAIAQPAVIGGLLLALAVGIGFVAIRQQPDLPAIASRSPVDALVRSGKLATMAHAPQQVAQGVAQLQEATMRDPQSADAWGALALGYGAQVLRTPPEQQALLRKRIEAAISRALTLDPAQRDALAARAYMTLQFGNWAQRERLERIANGGLPVQSSRFLSSVGRLSDALEQAEQSVTEYPEMLYPQVGRANALWGVGRLDEADRATADLHRLWPGNYLAFFNRLYFLLYSERAADALALLDTRDAWPVGIPEAELQLARQMAEAVASRDPAAADAVIARYDELSRKGRGYNENAIRIASALGRPDDAFRYAERLYLTPVDQLPRERFQGQQNFGDPRERLTELLFLPPVDKLHADPRFMRLLQRIGMVDYWKQSGSVPDFCRKQAAACRAAGIPMPKVSAR